MKKIILATYLSLAMIIVMGFLMPSAAQAAAKSDECHVTGSLLGFPTWYEYLEVGVKGEDRCAITGPDDPKGSGEFSFAKALPRIGLAIIDILLRIIGLVSVGFVIYGGFRYITSQGEPDATKKAQGTVVNALIGMAIAIFAVTIVSFVGSTLWK